MDVTTRKFVTCPDTPKPPGPYSHAVVVNNTAYIAGLIGTVPGTNQLVSDDVAEQTDQTLTNLGTILKTIGANYKSVIKITVLMADIKDYSKIMGVYFHYFSDHHPARSCYSVRALPKEARVEIESMALVGEFKDI